MGGYLVNFSVYTFAMIGFLFLAVMVYKKTSMDSFNKKNEASMAIEESLALSPRKRLHVVRVNGERFLIAADTERTEFLAKLDGEKKALLKDNVVQLNKLPKLAAKTVDNNIQNNINGTSALKTYSTGFGESKLSHIKNINMNKPPMFKEILRKLEIAKG